MLTKNLPADERWWKVPFRMFLDQVSATKGLLSGDAGYFLAIANAHLAFLYWLFFKRRKKNEYKRKKLLKLNGLYKGNVVWEHFVKRKTRFSEIVEPAE